MPFPVATTFIDNALKGRLSALQYFFLALIAVALVAVSFVQFELFIYGFLLLFTSFMTFLVGYTKSDVDFDPVFPFAILIAHFYGFGPAVLFVLLTDTIPFFIGGDTLDEYDFFIIALILGMSYVTTLLTVGNVLIFAVVMSAVFQFLSFIIISVVRNPGVAILVTAGGLLTNIAYLLSVGRLITFLLG